MILSNRYQMHERGNHTASPRERAAECSPGRKPGVNAKKEFNEPRRATEFRIGAQFLSPAKAGLGFKENLIPGLTPGATLCRHLRWLIDRITPK
jgi:hypothetical protein